MKSFIKFLESKDNQVDTFSQGTPVLVQQGGHSLPKPYTPNVSGKPFFDSSLGTPVLVQQGGHSFTKTPIKKPIKESRRSDEVQAQNGSIDPYHPLVHPYWDDAADTLTASTNPHLQTFSKRISPIEQVHTALSDQYDDALNQHRFFSNLYHYTEDSEGLNKLLFQNHLKGEKPSSIVSGHNVNALDSILADGRLQHPLTTFSGVKWHPGIQAAKHPSNRLFLPAYTSSSISPAQASRFTMNFQKDKEEPYRFDDSTNLYGPDRHLIRFNLQAGQQGQYLGDNSEFPNEKEFLLPRKTSLQLNPNPTIIPYKSNINDKVGRLHIWDAHDVKN